MAEVTVLLCSSVNDVTLKVTRVDFPQNWGIRSIGGILDYELENNRLNFGS